MKVLWVRGNESIGFNRPSTWFNLGVRGSGKSSLLECVGEQYLAKGHTILDLFGSRDGEGLAWLRSPYARDKKILLLRGEYVDVEAPCDVKTVKQLRLRDFEAYDILISASPLYRNIDDEFINAAAITDKLYRRLSWKRLIYGLVREASNLYYSRLKVSDNQIFAKSQMIYMLREARHCGVALGLDSVRYYAIDIDVRSISDFMILKSQGIDGLTSDLHWLYSIFHPHIIRNMPPQYFIILSRKGAIGIGHFAEVPWHKRERENILRATGIKVEYGEPVKAAEYRGTYKTVGDEEHSEMIRLYIEEGLGSDKIGARLGRSSRTPLLHIKSHNGAVERSGFCPKCRRVKSPYESVRTQRLKDRSSSDLIGGSDG